MRRFAAAGLAFIVPLALPALLAHQGAMPLPPAAALLDVVVVDRAGAAVDTLGPEDFSVTVNGESRAVTALRYVTRGPGAQLDMEALQASRGTRGRFSAEPARSIVLVVDQTTLVRGDEKLATAAARSILDRLGLGDRIAVVPLPLSGGPVSLDTDRPALVASLRGIAGQRSVASLSTPDPFSRSDRPVELGGERAGSASSGTTPPTGGLPLTPGGDQPGSGAARANVADLRTLFLSLGSTPGRKTVILLSSGLTGAGKEAPVGVDAAAQAAIQSHVVLHAFGLKASALGGELPDAKALEALARGTGGQFTPISRNPDQLIGRALADLSSCYVLTIAGPAPAGVPMRVIVSTIRPGLVVRAPGWVAARPDAPDVAPTADPAPADVPRPPPPPTRAERPREVPASAEAREELRRVLARVADYIDAYQRDYSSVVAEEEYDQSDWTPGATTRTLRLKSDLLLVRPDPLEGWVSFRDIFEVDGSPVRERDERLQRLFLDPSMESRARLNAIRSQSSRFNLGPVERNVNAPLFALAFLERLNQPRFHFAIKGLKAVDDRQFVQLDYRETASPTLTVTLLGADQPAQGRFLVDPVSGAVAEARVLYERKDAGQMEYVVRFQRSDTLGLWLPAEMRESYNPKNKIMTLGVARYRNFRRFQVSTDTAVVVPK